jgi:dTDP-4-amino-4,6-dideoxygalactose transaminase
MTAIGEEEKAAVMRVLDSGVLSGFLAGELHGGPEVQALEKEWAEYFGFKHAVAMNSATSCLIAACGALPIGRGDKVLIPPMTMSATGVAPLIWDQETHFGDIETDYFCLSPASVRKHRPDAIITVDLFGQISNPELRQIADEWQIPIIQDASQRPIPGGFGDIVVHSLNYHKHIHCGEGGVACTDSDEWADKLRLIRNHGENAPGDPMLGFNFRMGEIEAAIARVQLTKLPAEIKRRQDLAQTLDDLAPVRPGFGHAWYLFPHTKPAEGRFKYQKLVSEILHSWTYASDTARAKWVWESIWMTRP